MNESGALAIFVKTPGLSAVKTRLASSIGKEAANRFYELSLAAVSAVMRELRYLMPHLQIYWAVAEREGVDSQWWSSHPVIWQGNGSLGCRLSFVYDELLKSHGYVCFIGADSPHLTAHDLKRGIQLTWACLHQKFVLGETVDGGFYFFGGSLPLSEKSWLNAEYSTSQTSRQLRSELEKFAGVEMLAGNFDIDTVADLRRFSELSLSRNGFLPEQNKLIDWARSSQ